MDVNGLRCCDVLEVDPLTAVVREAEIECGRDPLLRTVRRGQAGLHLNRAQLDLLGRAEKQGAGRCACRTTAAGGGRRPRERRSPCGGAVAVRRVLRGKAWYGRGLVDGGGRDTIDRRKR